MALRFNPPAPLSLAAHFDAEDQRLNEERAILTAINAQAKELGYNFEGREDTLKILRLIVSEARQNLNFRKPRNEHVEPSMNDFYLLIHAYASVNEFPAIPSGESTVVLERFPKPQI